MAVGERKFERSGLGILSQQAPYRLFGKKSNLTTLNILLAYMDQFKVLQAPAKSSRRFAWLKPIVMNGDVGQLRSEGVDQSTLYVCTDDCASDLLEEFPLAFMLVISRSGAIPDWAVRNHNRIVLIESDDRVVYVTAVLQNLFTSMLVWEGALDRIVSAHGSVADLLKEGSRAFDCFMAVTDAGFNDIAHTTDIEPPTNAFRQLVETGCYTPDMVHHIEHDVLPRCRNTRTPVLDERRNDEEPDLLHFPIYYNGDYFFHLTMACNPNVDVRAAYDLFAIFSNRLNALCSTFWDDLILINSPWHRLLTNLIDGIPMSESYIATQLALMEIPESRRFCLLCFDLSGEDTPTKRSHTYEAASSLNGGACFPFAYNGRLLVLCHTPIETGTPYSPQEFARDIESRAPLLDSLRVGISEPFDDIREIHTAVTQALLAINLSPLIDAECMLCGKKRLHYCYSFTSVFPYYLTLLALRDNELAAASIQHGMLEILAREDRETGTDIVQLLWAYLSYERNATAASKQLHMHRNTVLYHIEKIERRFSVSFDDFIMRKNLLDEFRMYFLTDGFTHEVDFDRYIHIQHYQERAIL